MNRYAAKILLMCATAVTLLQISALANTGLNQSTGRGYSAAHVTSKGKPQ